MKKIITIVALLVIGFTNAQIAKYKASDFNLSADVTKYEDQEFYYEFGLKKYQLASTRTIYLNKGLVTKIENKSNYFLYMEATNTYNYKNGLLQSIHTKTQLSEYTENFIYQNGKIVEKNQNDTSGNKTLYEYDSKGNLSKETVYEKGLIVKNISYSNYTSKNSYHKKTVKYYNNEEEINEQIVKNGLLQLEKNSTKYSILTETYQYDKFGNRILYQRDKEAYKSTFEYDEKGNVLRSQVEQLDFDLQEAVNYFTFAKITYATGKTAGSANFDANYVKKYDSNSASYDVNFSFNAVSAEELTKAMNDLQASISAATYTIKKNEGNTYTIKDANGEEITNDVNAVRSNYDILVYDILFKKSILLKGFYTDAVKVGEWKNMEEFNSPTGLYWIFSDTSEFFVIQNGTLLDKSLFTLVKTQKEDDFIVREAGIDKYIIRDLNSKGFETFYPLEFLNN